MTSTNSNEEDKLNQEERKAVARGGAGAYQVKRLPLSELYL